MSELLIDDNYAVIGSGKGLTDVMGGTLIDETAGKAVLIEVAKECGMEISARDTKPQIWNNLINFFNENGVTKMSEENTEVNVEEIASQIITDGFKEGMADDDILVSLIAVDGISFKQAGTMFKKLTETLGLRISAKDRKEAGFEILVGLEFAPEDYDGVLAGRDAVMEGVADTNENQAMAVVRGYAKENELDLPKKAKGGGGNRGGGGKIAKCVEWANANPESTEVEFLEFVGTIVESEKQISKYTFVYNIVMTSRKSALEA